MNLVDTHLRLFGLLALLLPLYGAVQLSLLAVPITRVEVRVEPFEVQVPVEVPVERIVYVTVPTAAGGAPGMMARHNRSRTRTSRPAHRHRFSSRE